MTILLDTHLVLWMVAEPDRIPSTFRSVLENIEETLFYSAASIWEIAIKSSLGRDDFYADPAEIARELEKLAVPELPVRSAHCCAVPSLPSLHKDPFDRLLIAQARVEGMILHTVDSGLDQYGSMVRVIAKT